MKDKKKTYKNLAKGEKFATATVENGVFKTIRMHCDWTKKLASSGVTEVVLKNGKQQVILRIVMCTTFNHNLWFLRFRLFRIFRIIREREVYDGYIYTKRRT